MVVVLPSALQGPPPGGTRGDRPLRILDITDFYSETGSGGVKTYLHAKSKALAEQGVEHVLVVPGREDSRASMGATRVYSVRGPVLPVSDAYRLMLSISSVRAVLERERPDVIEVGSPFIVPHLLRRSGARAPTIGFYHADVVRTFAEPYVQSRLAAPIRVLGRMAARRLVQSVYRRFSATVAASASTSADLKSLGVPNVHTIGLGVDLDTFRPWGEGGLDRSALGIPEGRPVGVYAGRFCAEKRLDVFLDGHARLAPDERPHVVLIGDGPQRDQVLARVEGDPWLTHLPFMNGREELARALASADFYIGSGPGETFGLSIAEGLACGLPAVVVDRAAAPDRVEGSDSGERYRHGDPESAAEAIRRLVVRLSPELRDRTRSFATRTYDWRRTFTELVALYDDVATGLASHR